MKKNNFTKHLRYIFVSLFLLYLLFGKTGMVSAQFSGAGSGTSADPYHITTPEQLDEARNYLSAYYTLDNNIDLSSWISTNSPTIGWQPIGSSSSNYFSGSLDGHGHIISGLWCNYTGTSSSNNNIGLFGAVGGTVTVKNLGVVIATNQSVYGYQSVGGIIGACVVSNSVLNISSCYVSGSIHATYAYAGGLIGAITPSTGSIITVINSYTSSGMISTGGNYTGGLIGYIAGSSSANLSVSNCYSTDSISSGTNIAGGILGGVGSGTVSNVNNCVAINPSVTSAGTSIGRIYGWYGSVAPVCHNYAWDSTLVNGVLIPSSNSSATLTGKHGRNKSGSDLVARSIYADSANWDFTNVWEMGSGKNIYPILRNVALLPIKLTSFTVHSSGKINILQWKTSLEENSKGFIVLRSLNGSDFDSLTLIPSKKVASGSSYEHKENAIQIISKNVFYQLKLVDLDGESSYSNVVALTSSSKSVQLNLYPNPAQDKITIQFPSQNIEGYLQIRDVAGRMIQQEKITNSSRTSVNISNIQSGKYFITIGTYKATFIKVK